MGLFDAVFGQKKKPDELAKEWRSKLRSEQRQIEQIELEEQKIKRSMKEAAKRDQVALKMLAKELVHSRKAKNRLHVAKAQINSVQLQLTQQMSQIKVMGALQKSTEVMQYMNSLMKLPELSKTMREMAKEMEKAGIIEEMVSETMDDVLDADGDEDEESEQALNEVIDEVLNKTLGATKVGASQLKQPAVAETDGEVEEEDDELGDRFNALKQGAQ